MHASLMGRGVRRAFSLVGSVALVAACADDKIATSPSHAVAGASAQQVGGPTKGSGCGRCGTPIVFVTGRDGNLEIYSAADTAGAAAVRLTSHVANDMHPTWSPDYKKIAFTSYRDGVPEIYVMNANGAGVTRLTSNTSLDAYPVYSPDGKKIAFMSDRDGNQEIYVMNADGSNVKRLTFDAGYDIEPTWSPDGTRIAFTSERESGLPEIWIMNATDGSQVTRFSPASSRERGAHWSPDGQRIAFVATRPNDNAVMWREVKTRAQTDIVTHEVVAGFDSFGEPSWSPDGTRLAFSAILPVGQTYMVMDAFDSSKGTLFTAAAAGSYNVQPAWSR